MPITRHMAVVFRVAAGPRLGFGHLVRCRALARALGVQARVSVRGTPSTVRAAAGLGLRVLSGGLGVLTACAPAVLVIDDPSAAAVRPWLRAARRRGVPVVMIDDAGRLRLDADLVVDGSVRTMPAAGRTARLHGPRFAILDAGVAAGRASRRPRAGQIVVAVGGGAHVFSLVPEVVAQLAREAPGADILVAPGFTGRPRPALAGGRWLAPGGLTAALRHAHLAIVAGGITAYEACAIGVPMVAVSVVAAQEATVRALARHGAVVDGGSLGHARAARRVVTRAAALLAAPGRQRRLTAAARQLVDGRGAARVSSAIRALASRGGLHG